ncbi:MAG: 50S ribosomal protein L11 methyltransferase [Sphingomonadales bacterium]|nr:50S ribosomal protein L11 methyltransferase [Sphingomonadales bacterium]
MTSWKLTLPCTQAEAEALAGNIAPLADLDPPPALMTSEIDEERPEDWRLDAYFEDKPDKASIALLRSLLPSAADAEAKLERLEDRDWVAMSQQGIEPIREGRFYVHTPSFRGTEPDRAIALEIDASRAFGTGRHETTAGCLAMLDRLKSSGRRFVNIADIGTGTGLLAFAALALWPRAKVIASDIDPLAIEIAGENAAVNGIRLGWGDGRVALVTASGFADRRLKRRAPYDLIIANILAGPLIALAPAFAHALAPGGTLILSGLLTSQADEVTGACRRHRLRLAAREERGQWTILRLVKRAPSRARRPASRA